MLYYLGYDHLKLQSGFHSIARKAQVPYADFPNRIKVDVANLKMVFRTILLKENKNNTCFPHTQGLSTETIIMLVYICGGLQNVLTVLTSVFTLHSDCSERTKWQYSVLIKECYRR